MSRAGVGLGLVGTFLVFLAFLYFVPLVKSYISPEISGFEDMSCTPGLKPCPEGYFCEQSTCVPILPRYDVNNVKPGGY
jgi:hypothetical protein